MLITLDGQSQGAGRMPTPGMPQYPLQGVGPFQPSPVQYLQQQQPNTGAYQTNAGIGFPPHRTGGQFQPNPPQVQIPGNSGQFQPPGQQGTGVQFQSNAGQQGYGWQQTGGFGGAPPQTPPDIELKTLENNVVQLETALSGLERELVHFLNREEFITYSVCNKVLDPRSTLDEDEKAGELVKGIKKRVKQDSASYYAFLNELKRHGKRYQPIISKLEAEYAKLQGAGTPGEWVSVHTWPDL